MALIVFLSNDRAGLIGSAQNFGIECCRALQLLNGYYTTGEATLRNDTKHLSDLPNGFADRIDVAMGAKPASDQDVYDSVEALWADMKAVAEKHSVRWLSDDIEI